MTKPVSDVPENRLSAEEVDDNFLEAEDAVDALRTLADKRQRDAFRKEKGTPIAPSLLLDFEADGELDPRVTFTRASSGTFFDQLGVLQTAAAGEARFDYDPATLAAQGLLIEEQRTNSIRNSTAQGAVAGTPGTAPTNWVITGTSDGLTREIIGTGVENGITYVDVKYSGTTTASSVKIIAFEAANHIVASSGQTWAASAYVKIASGSLVNVTSVNILTQGRDSGNTTFTETFTTPFTPSATLTRFVAASTLANASTAFVRTSVNFTYLINTAIDITLRIGLPQLELGAFATSVIPTTSASATRNADAASMTGTNFSSWYNAAEGTIYTEGSSGQTTAGPNGFASIEDGTINNRIQVRRAGEFLAERLSGIIVAGGSTQASLTSSVNSWPVNTSAKIVLGYKVNDIAQTINSASPQTDSSATIPSVDRMIIGGGVGVVNTNGHIRRIAYYPTRLANEQLQALTG